MEAELPLKIRSPCKQLSSFGDSKTAIATADNAGEEKVFSTFAAEGDRLECGFVFIFDNFICKPELSKRVVATAVNVVCDIQKERVVFPSCNRGNA